MGMDFSQDLQNVSAVFSFENGAFSIVFADPAYVRADGVVLDPKERSIGVILHERYHGLPELPESLNLVDIKGLGEAQLSGSLPDGSLIQMQAELRVAS